MVLQAESLSTFFPHHSSIPSIIFDRAQSAFGWESSFLLKIKRAEDNRLGIFKYTPYGKGQQLPTNLG